MSELIRKSHNVSVLLYHFVCPAKYRRVVFSEEVDTTLKDICLEISKRYEIHFVEIGTDQDHVHYLVQSVPKYSPTEIITIIKSITAKEIFKQHPEVKKIFWGSEFWSDGYFVGSVGEHGNEQMIQKYVQQQGDPKRYKALVKQQLTLFE
jgi:REP element-mobilizing transposase RayT|tara:strand:+ start:112 stop:561 length:450 start_codon:yes stop_codon:yes gene_type:complete